MVSRRWQRTRSMPAPAHAVTFDEFMRGAVRIGVIPGGKDHASDAVEEFSRRFAAPLITFRNISGTHEHDTGGLSQQQRGRDKHPDCQRNREVSSLYHPASGKDGLQSYPQIRQCVSIKLAGMLPGGKVTAGRFQMR